MIQDDPDDEKILWVYYALTSVGYAILHVGIALKLLALKCPKMIVGLAYTSNMVCSMLGSLIVSHFLRRPTLTIVVSTISMMLLSVVILSARNSALLVASFSLVGYLYAALAPTLTYMLVETRHSLRSSVSTLTIPQNLGWSLGFLTGALACYVLSLDLALMLCILSFGLSTVLTVPLASRVRVQEVSREIVTRSIGFRYRARVPAHLVMFYVSTFTGFVATGIFFTALIPILNDLGLRDFEIYTARAVGAFCATFAYIYTIDKLLAGELDYVLRGICASKLMRATTFMLSYMLFLTGTHMLLLVETMLLLCTIGFAWSFLNTGLKIFALYFKSEAHKVLGMTNFLTGLGFVVGSLIASMLLDVFQEIIPILSGLLAIISAVLYLLTARIVRRGFSHH